MVVFKKKNDRLFCSDGSSIVISIVRMACEREEARLRLVAPIERFFVAWLYAKFSKSRTTIREKTYL